MEPFTMDLPRVLRIEPISTDRLTLPIHEMFHRKQYNLVKAIDNTKLKLPTNLMPNWNKGIEAEGDLSRESTFSRHTAELLKKDEERDELLESIFFIVRGNKLSSVSANREAAKRIDEKLRAYYSDTRKAPYDKESSLILGIKKRYGRLLCRHCHTGLDRFLHAALHHQRRVYRAAKDTQPGRSRLPTAPSQRRPPAHRRGLQHRLSIHPFGLSQRHHR